MDVQEIIVRIEELLKARGITKGAFLAAVDISSPAYSNWKTGKTKPAVKTLRRVADVLGVSYEYLLTGDEEQKNAATQTSDGDVTLQKVVEFMKSLDVDQLRYLKQWADVLTFEQEHK